MKHTDPNHPLPHALGVPGARHSVRLWIGFAISALGIWALFAQFWAFAQTQPVVLQALGVAWSPHWRRRWALCR